METIKVLLADDHTLWRQGLRRVLEMDERICVVGEAANGDEVIELARSVQPDLVLMDINMPGPNGVEATKAIKREYPEIGIIVLTIHDDQEYLFEVIRAGAAGYLLKDVSPDQLISAIVEVYYGKGFLHPAMANKLFQEFARLYAKETAPTVELKDPLSEREMEVLALVTRGMSNREIAKALYLSDKTVKNHLSNIFRKLGVADRTQAALLAVKGKLIKM